jgi:predicted dehydrogenase
MASRRSNLRFGVLGTALIATKVAQAIHKAKGASLAAIASRTAAKARSWAARHDCPKWFGSYEALLDDPDVDVVYVPLPNSMHHEWTIRAAEKRKHVLCEKPIAASLSQAIEMTDACRACGVQFMDGVMWVHHARAARFRSVLDKGALGKLRRVTSAFTFCWEKFPKDDIRLKPELAGGSLGDLGWYCIRATTFVFGSPPREVWATARWRNSVDVNVSAVLWYDGDRIASFDCGFDTVMRQWFEAAGTRGSLVCDDFVLPHSVEAARFWIHDGSGKKHKEHVVRGCDQVVCMIEDFAAAVRSGRLNAQWPADAVETMRVCEAVQKAARTESRVSL